MRDFGRTRGAFGFGERGLRGRECLAQCRQVGLTAAGCGEAGFDIDELGFQARRALLVIAQRRLQLIAAGRQIGERAGEIGEGFFRCGKRRVCRGDAVVDAGQAGGVGVRVVPERLLLGDEPVERCLGIGSQRMPAPRKGSASSTAGSINLPPTLRASIRWLPMPRRRSTGSPPRSGRCAPTRTPTPPA